MSVIVDYLRRVEHALKAGNATDLSHGAVAAAALAILLGGYTWRGVQDNGAHAAALSAWDKCLDTAFVDKASGKPFCQIELTRLPPPSQRLLAE